ncbi:ADAMTS-like protein 1 [Paramacrobiotus metropolitanus]|uniref:ADAMTS-like protein 1 n=1 Tax=Paramacrobiotus metropolitanus TaxID=2943436 RepID=UPI0024463265|nr:ADAMTS-like protein 1 [Paramacrobiotus metropolitanus]XP_055330584.1 ADAMTS-like protein 1 [Paramacrobiotus metropolitanus]
MKPHSAAFPQWTTVICCIFSLILSLTSVESRDAADDEWHRKHEDTAENALGKWHPDELLKNELEEATTEPATGWKAWSSWSECSRTCDGGAMFQYRTCSRDDGQGCYGEKVRYRLCNTQNCPPDAVDFRAQQCAAYNNMRFKGRLYRWLPSKNTEKPCALTCDAQDESITREMAPNVLDGTRCREGSLDMCINGMCMSVGCDLQLGSSLKLDACGICGGDGSRCGRPLQYIWQQTNYSQCSRPCGGGYQSTSSYCISTQSGLVVPEVHCDLSQRPPSQLRECNQHSCIKQTTPFRYQQYQWATESWGPCTAECSGGSQARRVFCLETLQNGTKRPVGDYHCTRHNQPPTERRCNVHACPQWQTSTWSACSASCGRGSQVRTVKCVDHKGFDSSACDKARKPADKKVCKVSSSCPLPHPPKPEDRPHSEQALPLVAPQAWNEQPPIDVEEALKYEDAPMFATGPWSECSATCGHGYRHRSVECKLYIRFSVKLVQLPDSECNDAKPIDREPCSRRPCEDGVLAMLPNTTTAPANLSRPNVGIEVTYSWHYEGYTGCTKTCLGGVRHAIIRCFRDHDQAPVEEKFCKNVARPPELKQSCNEIPCPPRWNTSEFSACSRTCGGGTQTRTIQCVQELGASAGDVLLLPQSSCSYPPPRDFIACASTDCAPVWDVEPFGPCSRTCGKGIMERNVVCRQRLASGDVQDIAEPDGVCPKHRPSAIKSCFRSVCPPGATGAPSKGHSPPVTLNMFKSKTKANKLKVANSAVHVLHEGTDLRLKCPVSGKPGQRPPVTWLKDGKPVQYSTNPKAHVKMSHLGAIKIRSLRKADAGTYTCRAGSVQESVQLKVVSRTVSTKQPSSPLFVGGSTGNTIQRFYANSTDALRILQTVSQKTTPFSNAIADNNGNTAEQTRYYADQSPVTELPALDYSGKNVEELVINVLDMFRKPRGLQQIFVDQPLETAGDGQKVSVRSRSGQSMVAVEWVNGEWSPCSRSCGGAGSQVRSSNCQARLDKEQQVAPHALCISAGLSSPPETARVCGWEECPEWRTTAWEDCESGQCFSLEAATQTRNVSCGFPNGSRVADELCGADSAPRKERECPNPKCKAVWWTGPWSECTVTCGQGGYRSRILKCVYFGTTKPAGNNCRGLERPPVKEPCEGVPECNSEEPHCRDHFKYCDFANPLKLCRQKAYRLRCCRTCNAHNSS